MLHSEESSSFSSSRHVSDRYTMLGIDPTWNHGMGAGVPIHHTGVPGRDDQSDYKFKYFNSVLSPRGYLEICVENLFPCQNQTYGSCKVPNWQITHISHHPVSSEKELNCCRYVRAKELVELPAWFLFVISALTVLFVWVHHLFFSTTIHQSRFNW